MIRTLSDVAAAFRPYKQVFANTICPENVGKMRTDFYNIVLPNRAYFYFCA